MNNQSDLLDSDIIDANNGGEEQIISFGKFIFLSFITLGVYKIWWTYKAWRFYKERHNLDVNPAARAIFSIFFIHSLFTRILQDAREKEYEEVYSPGLLSAGYVILSLLAKLPDGLGLISLFSIAFFYPPFQAFNFVKENSTEFTTVELTSFNNRQVGLIVAGTLFWVLVLYGLAVE